MTQSSKKEDDPKTLNGERANSGMRAQFYGTMQGTLTRIDVSNAPDGIKELYARARLILFPDDDPAKAKTKYGWNRAYAAEKMLAHLRPVASLQIELDTQINILRRSGHPAWEQYDAQRKQLYPAPSPVPLTAADETAVVSVAAKDDLYKWLDPTTLAARELLERVLNDSHWKSAQRYHKRGIIGTYTDLIYGTGVIVTALFFTVLLIAGFGKISLSPWTGMALVVVSGLLGAVFSILINPAARNITASIEDLLRWTSRQAVLLRLCVGAIAAVILYFFFEAGLVEGVVFPDLEKIGFVPVEVGADEVTQDSANPSSSRTLGVLVPNGDLSKLMIWSFLAGFSEQLVARMLRGVEETAGPKPT